MSAIEKTIPIHDIFPKAFPNVQSVIVLLIFQVVFVGGDILLLFYSFLCRGLIFLWCKSLILLVAAKAVI